MIGVCDYVTAFLAHSKENFPAFSASGIINQTSTALSAAFIWHEKAGTKKLKILSKIVF
jgi:hypothetical protein